MENGKWKMENESIVHSWPPNPSQAGFSQSP